MAHQQLVLQYRHRKTYPKAENCQVTTWCVAGKRSPRQSPYYQPQNATDRLCPHCLREGVQHSGAGVQKAEIDPRLGQYRPEPGRPLEVLGLVLLQPTLIEFTHPAKPGTSGYSCEILVWVAAGWRVHSGGDVHSPLKLIRDKDDRCFFCPAEGNVMGELRKVPNELRELRVMPGYPAYLDASNHWRPTG